jgi:purine-binding chemotaxis protein CheW
MAQEQGLGRTSRLADEPPTLHLLLFVVGGQRYAINVSCVERVVRPVELQPLPDAPEIVLGLLNFEGRPAPVLDIRTRFRAAPRQPSWTDVLILARTRTRTVALPVESVIGVVERDGREITPAEQIMPGIGYVSGVTMLEGGDLVYIHDLDRFLSPDEDSRVNSAMARVE